MDKIITALKARNMDKIYRAAKATRLLSKVKNDYESSKGISVKESTNTKQLPTHDGDPFTGDEQ